MKTEFLLAGFGGQGVMFAGKVLAYSGLLDGKQVSWMPSYGPEMRGGTANCSVILSDDIIGSPVVSAPDILVAMNLPSLDKFERSVLPGGTIYADSSLAARKVGRTDVKAVYVPATRIASDNGFIKLANMVMLGALLGGKSEKLIKETLKRSTEGKRGDICEQNLKAFTLGKNYK